MSSIFSDPGWRRGSTLLSGEVIDYDDAPTNSIPTAGKEIVGQIKVFQDVNPYTGVRNSNRLVYCVAARWKPANGTDTLTAANAGQVFTFSATAPMSEFNAAATAANVTAGLPYGVLDEYLTVTVRPNDIVWLVVKGPATMAKLTGAAIAAGAAVEVSATAGQAQTATTGVKIGVQIAGASAASAATTARVLVQQPSI